MFLYFLFLAAIAFMICYIEHITENIDSTLGYDYATFERFLEEFDKYVDQGLSIFDATRIICSDYHYDKDGKGLYLTKTTVKFDNGYMIFAPIDWIKYIIWHEKHFHRDYRVKGLWK